MATDSFRLSSPTTRRSFLGLLGAAIATSVPGSAAGSPTDTTDRYIVDTRTDSVTDRTNIEVIHDLDRIDMAVVTARDRAIAGMRAAPDITFERDQPANERLHRTDRDEPGFEYQWDKQSQRLPTVHRHTRGEGTRIAIIDTGVLETHPDLAGPLNLELSRNFTDDGGDHNPVGFDDHGTHVAGIAAAAGTDHGGVLGTAPATDLVDCRVFSGFTTTFGDVLAAVYYSAEIECDAANLSLGAYPLSSDDPQVQLHIEAFERAAAFATDQGTLLIAAAGNSGANLDTDGSVINYPIVADDVMSISATGPIGYRWDDPASLPENYHVALAHLAEPTTDPARNTNYGATAIDVSAPGGNTKFAAVGTGEQIGRAHV